MSKHRQENNPASNALNPTDPEMTDPDKDPEMTDPDKDPEAKPPETTTKEPKAMATTTVEAAEGIEWYQLSERAKTLIENPTDARLRVAYSILTRQQSYKTFMKKEPKDAQLAAFLLCNGFDGTAEGEYLKAHYKVSERDITLVKTENLFSFE